MATEGFGINLCFLKRGCLALQDGEFSTAQDFFGLLLIHNLLELVIRAMKAEEREGERLRERVPWKAVEKESRNGA